MTHRRQDQVHSPAFSFQVLFSLSRDMRKKRQKSTTRNLSEFEARVESTVFFFANLKFQTPCDPYVDAVRQYVNRLLGESEFWTIWKKGNMKFEIIQSFPKALSEMEKDDDYDLRSSLSPKFYEVRFPPFFLNGPKFRSFF